jgi:membrane-associated protein
MDSVLHFIDIILHLNLYLGELFNHYGNIVYLILFLIVFCETGLVITPFLPGDSLLFATGTIVAASSHNPIYMTLTLIFAAFCGDNTNYNVGRWLGPKVFQEHHRFLKHNYLIIAEKFYAKYGIRAIILGRFLPIFRTFVPFVAGIARMPYQRYISVSILSACLWVGILLYAGYFFGSIPWVKDNFSIVILAIIIISVLPAIIEAIRHVKQRKKSN